MLSCFLVIVLIYDTFVCIHSKIIPLLCPNKCKCRGKQLLMCNIHSLEEFPQDITAFRVADVLVRSCYESDLKRLNRNVRNQLLRIKCEEFISNNYEIYSNCFYTSNAKDSLRNCFYSFCIDCQSNAKIPRVPLLRLIRSVTMTPSTGVANHMDGIITSSNPTSNQNHPTSPSSSDNKFSIIVIGSLSTLALLINMSVMINLCCFTKLTVIILFGTSLTLFNVLLSLYGLTMTLFFINPHWRSNRICQGFTSIKLFSLGSGLYTMALLVLHRQVRNSVEEEREAVFKGIVYILEGVMLSGVFAVLCWIKTTELKYICGVINPTNSIDKIILGIEVWYYILAFILILWYFVSYFLRERYEDDGKAYITKDFPIFLMVIISFIIWVSGYTLTLPFSRKLFTDDNISNVIRVGTLMLPAIFQPIIYTIRNTRCCNHMRKDENNGCEEVLLVCECTDSETCPACDKDYAQTHNTMRDTVFCEPHPAPRKHGIIEEEVIDASDERINDDDEKNKLAMKEIKERKKQHSAEIEVDNNEENISMQNITSENNLFHGDSQNLELGSAKISITLSDSDATHVLLECESECTNEKEMLNVTNVLVEGRVSRGSTFFPVSENERNEISDKQLSKENHGEKKNYSKNEQIKITKEENDETNENYENKLDDISDGRNSTQSLEWDHSYSYSDSSVSPKSDMHSSDLSEKKESPININDKCKESTADLRIHENCKGNTDLINKDDSMEWDHSSGSQLKNTRDEKSLELKSINNYEWKPHKTGDSLQSKSETNSAISSGISSNPISRQVSMDNSPNSVPKHLDLCNLAKSCSEDDDRETVVEKDSVSRPLLNMKTEGTISR